MAYHHKGPLHWISWLLVIIGGLNWGLVGLGGFFGADWDVIHLIFRSVPSIAYILYLLVGLAALVLLFSKGGRRGGGKGGNGGNMGGMQQM